jgi:hypothetical protein
MGSIPDDVIGFFNGPNPFSRIMALGSTQPLTEMSTRNLSGGEERPARKADNFTAICESIVYKMWEPRRLTTLWASMACYSYSLCIYVLTFNFANCGCYDVRSRKPRITAVGIRCADPLKLALTSPTSGGRYVGIVRLRTKAMEFVFFMGAMMELFLSQVL